MKPAKHREKDADYYDQLFERQQYYNDHYSNVHYYVQWVQVEMLLRPYREKRILEIGCGTGQLAHMLQDLGYKNYEGFDFSPVAIKKARERCEFPLFVGDALNEDTYHRNYDAVVCLEVLEHLEADLKVLENIRPGTFVILSVPNFDDRSHVRWFRSQYQVRKRFFKHIDIQAIRFINNIYVVSGIRSDFKPGFFQSIFKTREAIGFSSFWKRVRYRLVHLFKIKHEK